MERRGGSAVRSQPVTRQPTQASQARHAAAAASGPGTVQAEIRSPRTSAAGQEVFGHGLGDRPSARMHMQLGIDASQMIVHGVIAQA